MECIKKRILSVMPSEYFASKTQQMFFVVKRRVDFRRFTGNQQETLVAGPSSVDAVLEAPQLPVGVAVTCHTCRCFEVVSKVDPFTL